MARRAATSPDMAPTNGCQKKCRECNRERIHGRQAKELVRNHACYGERERHADAKVAAFGITTTVSCRFGSALGSGSLVLWISRIPERCRGAKCSG